MIDIERKPGYLYLLKNKILGGYKIGITTAPTSRFKALAVGEKTELIGYWQHDGYRELERYYHKLYSVERVPQSEWFNLDNDAVAAIVDQMYSSAVTQYLSPEIQAQFVGTQFNFNPPADTSGVNGFIVAALAAAVAYLVGAQIG